MADEALLRATLPGEWRVLATTFPMWLSGRRLQPRFSYEEREGSSLVLRDVVSYRTRSGATRRIVGVDRYDTGTGLFTWRGRGVLGVLTSRWRVTHVSDDRDLVVLAFAPSLVTPAGVDVIGRGDVHGADARARLGQEPGPDLTWLED
ncbi:hypothetical protein Aab01nite_64450 [Paractinoplanes abujensis]|uniref:Uncharacterized protein n=1 Tax=Paractinoplanes abujensis TaxID=882441 RepID=A0A7W7CQN0_9ACTN|nr:hypothetical protein [Actinoplanes abujensis]MBB4692644.1 hypothetical protein [Actinoplanes abujensis]GID22855.1 hypothetical protein Aab01nite_64450 [Actinoplanes abujensis]